MDRLPAAIAAAFPDLAGATIEPLGEGHDCRTWMVAGDVVVKEPLHPAASAALALEARVLAVLAGKITLTIPNPRFCTGPPALSRHDLLPGQQLLWDDFAALTAAERDLLAQDLARFHAECHSVLTVELRAAGADPAKPWPAPDTARAALDALPSSHRALAREVLAGWAALPEDPLGEVWGHFDAHGWNMAFDPVQRRLSGIYDFGDSGFGPLHRDLIYSALISFDLTLRLGRAYRALTGLPIDLDRLRLLSGAHRLWELAEADDANRDWQVQAFLRWSAGVAANSTAYVASDAAAPGG